MTEAFRAERILTMNPQCPEIRDGGILVQEGRILAVGAWNEVGGNGVGRDLGSVTIVPGLINAHVHLELSHLAGRMPRGLGFGAWADGLFAAMRESRVTEAAMERAAGEARASGTCYLADVLGREFDMVRRVLERQGLGGFLFNEFSGRGREFCPRSMPGGWSPSVHALYSTEHTLARTIKEWSSSRGLPFSLHLAEAPGENELFQSGSGEFADFLRTRRILPRGFAAPGLSAVSFARELGLLDERTLAVHCVQVDENDVEILAASGACVCLCPRSNSWIGVGDAPVAALFASGVPLCLGTDSLASVPSLDLWQELRAVRVLMPPQASLFDLLALVTRNPARVLGIEADYGSLAVGKRAVWAVLPDDMQ
jgi:cytosine/adenosine deaminase-related metal-dependent hydrolase